MYCSQMNVSIVPCSQCKMTLGGTSVNGMYGGMYGGMYVYLWCYGLGAMMVTRKWESREMNALRGGRRSWKK